MTAPPFTVGELLGLLTRVINVWLLVRQNPANWPVGIANVLLLLLACDALTAKGWSLAEP